MLRAIIVGIIVAAVAVAVFYPLTPWGVVWKGPDFLAPGIDLPEARYFGDLPDAPVFVLSEEGAFFDGKYILPINEASINTNSSNHEFRRLSAKWGGKKEGLKNPTDPYAASYLEIIIQADEEVKFEALNWAIFTAAMNRFAKPYLAAWDPESKRVKGILFIVPWFSDFRCGESDILSINVEGDGFRLCVPGAILPFTPKKGSDYDYRFLEMALKDVKGRYGTRCNNIIIVADEEVKYGDVIHMIDVSIQSGFESHDICLSGTIEP